MVVVRTVPTADLDVGERAPIRALLNLAFVGRFSDEDWDHTLGGLHFLVAEGGSPIAHAAVVQRRFLHQDQPWRCGYVEAVAVDPAHQGRGLAAAVMTAAERVIDRSYHLGALSASTAGRGLYVKRGWLPWQGPTYTLSPTGPARTPEDDDSTLVRAVPGAAPLALNLPLTCDWRDGDVW